MKSVVLDTGALKRFSDTGCVKEQIWSDHHGRITLICLKPGQEIHTHTHHGSHIWMVMEGTGEFMSGKDHREISVGQIVVVPPLEDHGIRNGSDAGLVIASITGSGD